MMAKEKDSFLSILRSTFTIFLLPCLAIFGGMVVFIFIPAWFCELFFGPKPTGQMFGIAIVGWLVYAWIAVSVFFWVSTRMGWHL